MESQRFPDHPAQHQQERALPEQTLSPAGHPLCGAEHWCQTPAKASRKRGADGQNPFKGFSGFQREPLQIAGPAESPGESAGEEQHSHVVGTQGALAGVGDSISATHGVVDHGAGQQLSAILEHSPAVLAAVQLGTPRTTRALPRALLRAQTPAHPPCLGLCQTLKGSTR